MNENQLIIKLLDITENDHPFGNVQGREAYRKLVDFVEAHPLQKVLGISLEGIAATDASFPRESVISLAKLYRGERWFFLQDFASRDLIDNWRYAAKAKEQPLFIWHGDDFEIIGPDVNSATEELIRYVVKNGTVTASKVAADLNLTIHNASTRLKRLVSDGYLMRTEEVAPSGGKEYLYRPCK